MDGEQNGSQEARQGGTQEQEIQGQQQELQATQAVGDGTDREVYSSLPADDERHLFAGDEEPVQNSLFGSA